MVPKRRPDEGGEMAKKLFWLILSLSVTLSFMLSSGALSIGAPPGKPQAASQVVTSVPEKKFFPGVYSEAEQKMLDQAYIYRSRLGDDS
jgi:hypothetical protein